MIEAPAPELATLRDFARLLRVKPSYITELKKGGRLVLNAGGRVRVKESLALIESTRSPAHDSTVARHAEARGNSGPAGPRTDEQEPPVAADDPHSLRRAKALADRAELDARKAARDEQIELAKLLHADDVRAVLSEAVSLLRRGLEGMPDVMAPVLAATSDEGRVRVLMAEEVERLLGNVARTFQSLIKDAGP